MASPVLPRFFASLRRSVQPAFAMLLVLHGGVSFSQNIPPKPVPPQPPAHENYNQRSLSFEANQGQAGREVKFLARGRGYSLFLTPVQAILLFPRGSSNDLNKRDLLNSRSRLPTGGNSSVEALRMQFRGAEDQPSVTGESELAGRVNYFLGNDPAKWHTSIPIYSRVRYKGVYPGIDLLYYGNQQKLEYDFVVAPGGNPSRIKLHFDRRKMSLNKRGDLLVHVSRGVVVFRKPAIYQAVNGRRLPIQGGFRLLSRNTVGFAIGRYNRNESLVIDPVLVYSTYLGGSGNDAGNAIAVDTAGNAYVTGATDDTDFPTSAGAFQTVNNGRGGSSNAFVTKFNSNGSLVYSTYLGGSVHDGALGIAVDSSGNAYVAGYTTSPDFPTTAGAFQTADKAPPATGGGNQLTAFVTKLNGSGTGLVYSTFLGGSNDDASAESAAEEEALGIAVDSSGDAYVTGYTYASDFPTTSGSYQTVNNGVNSQASNAFVTKLNPAGTALDYSTYLGGSLSGSGAAIAVDSAGSAYIGGGTFARDFPTTTGAFQTTYTDVAGSSGFITKLNAAGSGLGYSTFLGGSHSETLTAIALDSDGNVYATGGTVSTDFPVTTGAFQTQAALNENGFVTKLNSTGTSLVYSTYLEGKSADQGNAIAVDSAGNAYISGETGSMDFPLTSGALQTTIPAFYNGDYSSFVTKLNSAGTGLLYSTFLAGSGSPYSDEPYLCDCVNGVALDSARNLLVTGTNVSPDFPTTPGAFQPSSLDPLKAYGTSSAFVTKFNASEMTILPLTATNLTVNANPQFRLSNAVFTALVQPASGSGTPTGTIEFSSELGLLCDLALNGSGEATCSTQALPRGTYTVTAAYSGDSNYSPSTATVDENILGVPTTTTITASQSSAVYGNPITFNVHVVANTGSGIPTSVVDFVVGNTQEAGPALDSNGNASWIATSLGVGNDTVTAEYTGDPNYATSSASVNVTIQPLGVTPAPTFNPAGGTYTQIEQVGILDTNSAATIYYTTDGTIPTTNSAQYAGGSVINVDSTEMIQAIATAPGYSVSGIASATYTINLPPPDFSMALSPTSLTVSAGQQASTTLSITPSNGFQQTVSFSCSGLPTGTSCSFSPPSVTSAGPSSIVLTIAALTTAASRGDSVLKIPVTSLACVILLLLRSPTKRNWRKSALLVGVTLAMFGSMSACGGGSGGGGGGPSSPVTSTVTVTATSSSVQHTASLTVTVD